MKEKVIKFISEQQNIKISEINKSKKLLEDLKIDGDDAEELIHEFSCKFNVDIRAIDISKYFYSEISLFILMPSKFKQRRKEILTVEDLIKAVEEKVLL